MMKAAFLFLALSIAAGCRKPDHGETRKSELPTAEVKAVEVTTAQHQRVQEVAGTVEAKHRALIEAKASGRIEWMPIRLGQNVKKGELLAQLDARERQARLDQAAAAQEQAETDLKRSTMLLRQQALTQAEFDAAQARSRIANAAVRETRTQLDYTQVLAPFDGVVVRKLAEVGDLAAPGKPLLEMEDPATLRFVANVPETFIRSIRPGIELPVQFGEKKTSAKVTEIAPSGDPVSRTSRVELDLASADGVRSGSFGRLLVPAGGQAMLVVPSGAVVVRGQLEMVFVISSNRVALQLVRTGKDLGEAVEVLSGVSPGEKVVAENAAALRDGQSVSVR